MNQKNLVPSDLKTPRAAAIAGIVFSVLMISSLLLIRLSVRDNPLEAGTWLRTNSGTVANSLYLVPFAGIAFLWFIGVLRDRLGELEDRFVATVFFGSGLLFLAMLFTAAAVTGGIIIAYRARPAELIDSAAYAIARDVAYEINEPLRGQDGGSLHVLYLHIGDPHRFHRTLDSVPRLCARAVSVNEWTLRHVDYNGFPSLGAIGQHPYPHR